MLRTRPRLLKGKENETLSAQAPASPARHDAPNGAALRLDGYRRTLLDQPLVLAPHRGKRQVFILVDHVGRVHEEEVDVVEVEKLELPPGRSRDVGWRRGWAGGTSGVSARFSAEPSANGWGWSDSLKPGPSLVVTNSSERGRPVALRPAPRLFSFFEKSRGHGEWEERVAGKGRQRQRGGGCQASWPRSLCSTASQQVGGQHLRNRHCLTRGQSAHLCRVKVPEAHVSRRDDGLDDLLGDAVRVLRAGVLAPFRAATKREAGD